MLQEIYLKIKCSYIITIKNKLKNLVLIFIYLFLKNRTYEIMTFLTTFYNHLTKFLFKRNKLLIY